MKAESKITVLLIVTISIITFAGCNSDANDDIPSVPTASTTSYETKSSSKLSLEESSMQSTDNSTVTSKPSTVTSKPTATSSNPIIETSKPSSSSSKPTVSSKPTSSTVSENNNSTTLIPHTHTYSEWKTTKKATCTATGTMVRSCMCGDAESKTIEKTEHNIIKDKAIAATCTKTGLTEGSHCAVCKTTLVPQKDVAKINHTVVIDESVAATCTTTGLTEGKHCSKCNTIIVRQNVTEILKHEYTKKYIASNGNIEQHILYTCKCGHNYKEDIKPVTAKITKSIGTMLVNGVRYDICFTVSDASGGYGNLKVSASTGQVLSGTDFDFDENNKLVWKEVTDIYLQSGKLSSDSIIEITISDTYGNSTLYRVRVSDGAIL